MGALLSKDEVSPVVGLTKTASSIVTYVSSDGNYTGKAAKAGLMNETVKTSAKELKEGVQELASEAKESVSGVLQAFVLALCAGFLVLMLGVLLLIVAII